MKANAAATIGTWPVPSLSDHVGTPDAVSRAGRVRLTANLFGIPLGLAGLSQCWTVARSAAVVPAWTVTAAWLVTAVAWTVVLVAYLVTTAARHQLRGEPSDPTFGPFTSLAFVVPLMLGVPLAAHAAALGRGVFWCGLILAVAYGGWLCGGWIVDDLRLEQLHPGYFLPTVATGLVAAAASAAMGYDGLARLLFGYGSLSWIMLGSILWARLLVTAPLPAALVPTLAIEVAPPVVAGNAWFAINGDQPDAVALVLAGYAVLMVLIQMRLVPVYVRLRFSPGWWAFSFSYAATVAVAMRWILVADVGHRRVWIAVLLVLITCAVGALALRTAIGLASGTFLLREPSPTTTQPLGAAPRDI